MRFLPVIAICLLSLSCATKKETPVRTYADMTMNERFNSKKSFRDKQGNWTPEVAGMKLHEEDRKSAYFSGDSNLPAKYETGKYDGKTSSWWAGKNYDTAAYGGRTDGSRFQTTARDQGKTTLEAGRQAAAAPTYATDAYATGQARETGRSVGTQDNALVRERAETFPEPDVTTGKEWQAQRTLDLRTTRGMVGRN